MLDLIRVTLEGVGHAIFNIVFLFGVWIIYLINRRMNRIDIYRIIKKKSMLHLMADILVQSILVGSFISFVLVFIGIPLRFNVFMLFLIPISVLLSMVRIRFLDISYAAAIISFLSMMLNGQTIKGYTLINVEMHIPSLIILVGIISLLKGVLIIITKDQGVIPIISQKDDQIVMGHIVHKSWIFPIGLLLLQLGELTSAGILMPDWWPMIEYTYDQSFFYTLLPFVGMISQNSISYTTTLKEHQRLSAGTNILTGAILLLMGALAVSNRYLEFVGTVFLWLIPEIIHFMRWRQEQNKAPIYTYPETGLRIMEVLNGGMADELGMETGEVIEKVNDILVQDFKHFLRMIKEADREVIIESRTVAGKFVRYEIPRSKDIARMGVRFIPEKPLIVYAMDQYEHIGLIDFIKGKYK